MAEGEAESEGQAPPGLMAGRQLYLYPVLSFFCVGLLMVETVSGTRRPFIGGHISPQFSASGVNQTPMEDVSIQVGSWHW